MRGRILTSLGLALSAIIATTGVSQAAFIGSDVVSVQVGTILVAVGFLFVLAVIFGMKQALGLVKPPPPQDDSATHAHH